MAWAPGAGLLGGWDAGGWAGGEGVWVGADSIDDSVGKLQLLFFLLHKTLARIAPHPSLSQHYT